MSTAIIPGFSARTTARERWLGTPQAGLKALPRPYVIVLVVLSAWALYQCYWNIGAANFHADEPNYINSGWGYLHGDFAGNREHPPTAKYLMGLVQVLFGQGVLAPRILTSTLVLATGVVIWFWLRREAGPIAALSAASLWLLLPRGVEGVGDRLDRFAVLEPYMVCFAIMAFAAMWQWYRRSGWLWLILGATLMAASVTSKLSSAVILPAILLLPLFARSWRMALAGGAVFVAVFCSVFTIVYLPMGMRSALAFMLQMQSEHNAAGHLVDVAGLITAFPPWWANIWYMFVGVGIPGTVALSVATAAVVLSKRVTLWGFLGTALLFLAVFYLIVSSVALGHYYYGWMGIVSVLAGLGLAALLRPGGGLVRRGALLTIGAVITILALLSAVGLSVSIWKERPKGAALVEHSLVEHGVQTGSILTAGVTAGTFGAYLGDRATSDQTAPGIVAVLVGWSTRYPPDPVLLAFIDDHKDRFVSVQLDDLTLYIVDGTLQDRDGVLSVSG